MPFLNSFFIVNLTFWYSIDFSRCFRRLNHIRRDHSVVPGVILSISKSDIYLMRSTARNRLLPFSKKTSRCEQSAVPSIACWLPSYWAWVALVIPLASESLVVNVSSLFYCPCQLHTNITVKQLKRISLTCPYSSEIFLSFPPPFCNRSQTT